MFEDSLFATNRRRTAQQRWAAALSFILQAAFVTVIVGLPLFFTDALPIDYVRSFVELPSVPHSPGPPAEPGARVRQQTAPSELDDGRVVFHEPSRGPIKPIVDEVAPAPACTGLCVPGSPGPGNGENILMSSILGEPAKHWVVPPPPVVNKPVRISFINEGLLIHKITPTYPQIAIMARQQGTVVLHAIIARDGTIQQLQAVSGPPLLIRAAMEAVAQWRYRPYVLNGQPVEVDTQIIVNFKLGG